MKRASIFIMAAACTLLISTNGNAGPTNTSGDKSTTDRLDSNQAEPNTYAGPLFPALKDGKYGFIDIKGNLVIPPTYTSVGSFREGLARVMVGGSSYIDGDERERHITSEGGKWGYINRTGQMMIPPQFAEARDFSEGLALASVEEDRPSLEEFLEAARPLNLDHSDKDLTEEWWKAFGKERPFGYIERNGLFRIIPKYSAGSTRFKNGVASVRLPFETSIDPGHDLGASELFIQSLKEHWIDASGQELTAVKALKRLGMNRHVFHEEKAIMVQGQAFNVRMYGLKDENGTIVIKAKFSLIAEFYDLLDLERISGTTTACLPNRWKIIVDTMAEVAGHKCGIIALDGRFVAPPDFDYISPVSDDLAVFTIGCPNPSCMFETKRKNRGLYSTKERKVIVNPIFDDMRGFSDGLIAVKTDGYWGYIDASGQYVIHPKFTSAGRFVNGLASVDVADYIDRTGKYVYRGSLGTLKPKRLPSLQPDQNREVAATVTGTGFVVSRQGHVLTNHHVIAGCRTLRATVDGSTKALTVVGSDAKNDLAVIKLPAPSSAVAHFKEGRNIRSGDGVVVVGFPLHGLLAAEANVTTGTVSALAGIGNDTRFLQITAPVQPGNSGGPLLDQSGNIVGVVVSKLDTMRIAKVTGDVPQNINFAINGTVARAFLNASGVQYETSTFAQSIATAEIAESARTYTLLVECLH